jgi:hypothetical protein
MTKERAEQLVRGLVEAVETECYEYRVKSLILKASGITTQELTEIGYDYLVPCLEDTLVKDTEWL